MIRSRCIAISVAAFILASVCGCAVSPLATRTAAFSNAASATITQTTNAYQLVNQQYFDEQVAMLVVNYKTEGFDPSKIKPFLPAKDLAARTEVLDGLQQYATLLAEVSGNQPITDLETQATSVGNSLAKLQQDDFKSFKISDTDRKIGSTAIVALGSILIEHERAGSLPQILDKMNQPVQQICSILEADIGTVGKPGLASALHRHYDLEIAAEQRFIRDNTAAMTAEQKRAEIEKLPELVLAQEHSDEVLATTSKSLAALAAAHAALAETAKKKDSPAFKLELSRMEQDAQQLNDFYSSLK